MSLFFPEFTIPTNSELFWKNDYTIEKHFSQHEKTSCIIIVVVNMTNYVQNKTIKLIDKKFTV